RNLGDAWPGGCAGAPLRDARPGGAAARPHGLWRGGRNRPRGRRRRSAVNRFATLLDRLAYEGGRNNKLKLTTDYFRSGGDPERGWALAALTGALRLQHAKPGIIRTLI